MHLIIIIEGDWKKYHGANRDLLYMFEPVVESLLQLLVQTLLLFVVVGPQRTWEEVESGRWEKGE